MRMFIPASILVRFLHQGRLLSLQKVTLYWLPIDRLAAGDVFSVSFSLSLCVFVSLGLCLCLSSFICFRMLSVIVVFTLLFCYFYSFSLLHTTNAFDVFLSFHVILNSSSFFLPLHSSSIIYLRAAPSRVSLWVPSGADYSQSRRSAHMLVCVWM